MSDKVELIYEGTVPKADVHYSKMKINGQTVGDLLFTHTKALLKNGEFLAIQNLLTINMSTGPKTRVALIDLNAEKIALLDILEGGFVEDFQLKDDIFSYTKTICDESTHAEIPWNEITNWQPIAPPQTSPVIPPPPSP